MTVGPTVVCKIPLLARAFGLKTEQSLAFLAKRARDDRVFCIQGLRLQLTVDVTVCA